jgi:hypothetical protein
MNDETIRDFINKHSWTFAKTYMPRGRRFDNIR